MSIIREVIDLSDWQRASKFQMLKAGGRRRVGPWSFVVLVYGAYNAMGLIGTEHNGIVVLEESSHQVVLDGHFTGMTGHGLRQQLEELERLLALDDVSLLSFINGHPNSRRPYLSRSELRRAARDVWAPQVVIALPPEFTPTEFDTAADKARFARHFQRFVAKDFRATLFPQWFYRRLSGTFGHIAHFNRNGFASTWFHTTQDKVLFLQHTLDFRCYGQPAHTYVDVERWLIQWLRDNQVLEQYQERLRASEGALAAV